MSAECSARNVPPGYKQTEVGVIPEDWECLAIGNSIDLLTGFPFPSIGYSKSGIRLLRGSNVKRGVTDWSEEGTEFWPAITSEIRKYVLKTGDVVIAMDGSLVGRSFAMLSESDVPAVLLQRVARIRSESIEQKFLKAWVCSQRFTEHCDAVKTVTAIPHISPADIKSFKIALPPTKVEQEAIAEALSDADALIESLEQLITKKRQIKQGAMQKLLTGKRRLPGFSGEWETKLLGEVIASCSSGATPYRGRSDYYKGKVKWITSGELNYNLITETLEHISDEAVEHTNLKIHPVGTFLMAITGLEAAGTRGACGIVGSLATTNQSCMAVYPTSELKTEYLYHYYVFRGNELALQYCQGTKQQSYTAKLVKLLPIDLPPSVEEQTAINNVLSDMDSEITVLEDKLAKARQLKQGMMQELLTGRTRLV